jgi:hypothetical protein
MFIAPLTTPAFAPPTSTAAAHAQATPNEPSAAASEKKSADAIASGV